MYYIIRMSTQILLLYYPLFFLLIYLNHIKLHKIRSYRSYYLCFFTLLILKFIYTYVHFYVFIYYYAVLWLVFTWSPHPWSLVEITPVLPTFCGYYPCVHYFYVPWPIMTSQWVMTLLGMSHCGTTMGNDVAMNFHYDITMDNDVAMNLLCHVLLR